MTTALTRPVRRALRIDGRDYVVTVHEQGFKLTEKGRRLGLELAWSALVSGEAALAVALSASLQDPSRRAKRNAPGKPKAVRAPLRKVSEGARLAPPRRGRAARPARRRRPS